MEPVTAYLDNAATTQVSQAAADTALRMMRECFGNPSSLHALGVASARALAGARESVAGLMGCQPERVIFTGCGSEANNLAILGGAQAKLRRGRKLVTTAAEHSSVAAAMKHLAENGWQVTFVPPDRQGNIDPAAVADAVDGETTLVSMMMVNNETGALFPVEETAELIRRKNPDTLIHCDGVQALGKLPLKLSRSEIDLLSASAHKIQGPKGAGALYIRRGARVLPLIHGGGQERGLRAGTEALPALAAFGTACDALIGHEREHLRRAQGLWDALEARLEAIDGVQIHSPRGGSPYILNLSVPGWRSETMLHFLESRGVYVSSGSACSKGAASPVLTAMGLSEGSIDSALRVSFIYDTAPEAVDLFCDALCAGMESLRRR